MEADVGGEDDVLDSNGIQPLGRLEVRLKMSLDVPNVTSKVARRERVEPILVVTE